MTEELPEIPGFRYARPLGKYVHLYRGADGEVAVKLLADPPRAAEIRTVLGLGHPGIVVVHRAGRTRAGLLYLVMKHYATGTSSRPTSCSTRPATPASPTSACSAGTGCRGRHPR
jgi:hypothetical protein